MPQMAPMSWINLFIMFSLTFMIINSLNYYLFMNQPKTSNSKKTQLKINWKW